MKHLNNGQKSHIVKHHNNGRTISEISQHMKIGQRAVRKFLEGRKGYPGPIAPAHAQGMRKVDRGPNAVYAHGQPLAAVTLPAVAFLERRLEWEIV